MLGPARGWEITQGRLQDVLWGQAGRPVRAAQAQLWILSRRERGLIRETCRAEARKP